ncbi:MAG: dipeptidase PepV [Proteocatella sp.]
MENLNQRIDKMENEIISGIRENLAICSVKGEATPSAPFGEGPKEALINALSQAEKLGLKTKNIDNKVGYAEIGDGEEMVAILGHLDIVPLGEGWEHDPLAGEIHNGVMHGRGVSDDKGPTIGAIYALKAIKDLELNHNKRIRVIFGTDEESGSQCVAHYINSGEEMPVAGFTPDADFPIINAEKGTVALTLKKTLKNNVNYDLVKLTGGTAKNVVMPSVNIEIETALNLNIAGKAQTGNIVCEVFGKSAHASTPEKGENALLKLFNDLKDASLEGDLKDFMDFINKEINLETNGETLGINCSDEESGELTLNLGLVSYENQTISVTVDIRYPVTKSPDPIEKIIIEKASKFGVEVCDVKKGKPLFVPKESELISKLSRVYEAQTGNKAQLIGIGGGTYAKAFPNMVAFGPAFPGEDHVIHQPNERISVESLIKGIKISAAAILELAE